MEKENFKAEYPKMEVHWSVKVLGWAWVMAVVFVIGMVIGGMIDAAEEDGAKRDGVKGTSSPCGVWGEEPHGLDAERSDGSEKISELILY